MKYNKAMNNFFDTAIGKSVQTFLWTLASYIISLLLVDLANVHWSAKYAALGIPGLINLVLYTAKVFLDKEVPNFSSSVPVRVVPIPSPALAVTSDVGSTPDSIVSLSGQGSDEQTANDGNPSPGQPG